MGRVALLINSLTTGGAERQMSQLADYLAHKYTTKLFLFEKDVEVKGKGSPTSLSSLRRTTPSFFRALAQPVLHRKLERSLEQFRPRICVSALEIANLHNIILARKRGWKSVIMVGCYLSNQYRSGVYGWLFRMLIKRYYPAANLIIVNSVLAKEDLVETFRVSEEKAVVLHNWLDTKRIRRLAKETFSKSEKALFKGKTIVAVGRLTKAKGYDFLIKSFAYFLKRERAARLLIIGEGEDRRKLEQLIGEHRLDGHVLLLGLQKNPFKFMQHADIVVMSSRWEGFPNVLLEALVLGKPVIAPDCKSGPREILAPGTQRVAKGLEKARYGFLTPPIETITPATFGAYIIQALSKTRALGAYAREARARAHDFAQEHQLEQFEHLIEKVSKDL